MTQAEVTLQVLSPKNAQNQMSSPAKRTAAGEPKSTTLTFPLLLPNQYLVVKLPDATAKELVDYVRMLPKDRQRDFVFRWVESNRKAVIEQYIRGGKEKLFTFEIVPMRSIPLGTVPSRTPAPPRTDEVAEFTPENKKYNITEPTLTPSTASPSQVPLTPPPQAKKPVPRPSEISGGMGIKEKPYTVALQPGRESKGAGATEAIILMPFKSDDGTTIYFDVKVTASQLSEENISSTASALNQIVLNTIRYRGSAKTTVNIEKMKESLRTLRRSLIRREEEAGGKKTPVADYFLLHGGQ
jgi:hypothetical protein